MRNWTKSAESVPPEEDVRVLRIALENDLRPDVRELFAEWLTEFTEKRRKTLSPAQRAWVRREAKVEDPAENLVSRGLVPRGREVATLPILDPKTLPKRPPGKA